MALDRGRRDRTHEHHCLRPHGKWRVPEKTLFLATALFGGLGGTLGMFLFRHKTKHWYFRVFFPLFLLLQAAAIVYYFVKIRGIA